MSVRAVEIIEETILDKTQPIGKRITAGFVRFCIGARLRHSDATRIIIEPKIDDGRPDALNQSDEEDEHDNRMMSFVETHGTIPKRTRRKPSAEGLYLWSPTHGESDVAVGPEYGYSSEDKTVGTLQPTTLSCRLADPTGFWYAAPR